MERNDASNIIPLHVRSSVEKCIKFDPRFSAKCQYLETAVLLSYFIGLHKHFFKLKVGEEFYRTRKQQIEDTGLSKRRVEKAEREAIEKGLIKKEKKGIPATNHYILNLDAIYAVQGDGGFGE